MDILKTDKHLDWLSITIPSEANWRQFLPFPDLYLSGKGRHGYGQAWIDKRTGARIETASTRDEMGTHLTLSGDVLRAMRDDLGAIDDRIVERVMEFDGTCSRVDLAIDCFGSDFTPDGLNVALQDGTARLPARTWRYIDGHKNAIHGATIDTGSSTSDRRFRFYDKRAEQGIKDGEAWVRLELQLRRLYAKAAIMNIAEHGCSQTVSGSIGAYLEWSDTDYQSAIASNGISAYSTPRKESNRRKWLLGQVALSLAKECMIEPYFRERFNQAVNGFLDNLRDVDNGNIK